jgi:serine protease Do
MKRWSIAAACLLAGLALGLFLAGPVLHGQIPGTTPAVLPRELTSYRDVVKTVLPAVVSVESRAKPAPKRPAAPQPRRKPKIDDERIPEELRKFFEDFGGPPFGANPFGGDEDGPPAPNLGFGSGFLVDPKGVVLTNYHVVDGADQVEVTLKDGRKFTSKDIKADPKSDLAIIKLDAKAPLPYLQFGDSDAMEIGDRVLAVGAPFGLTGSVTHGIISAKGRSLRMNMYEDFLQTDAAINPGNSGGPLVNLEGKVIGINAAIKSRTGGFQGIGLAIASNLAKNIMEKLEKDGVVHRGYLGVQIKDIADREIAAKLGVGESGGVLVSSVFEATPGAKAGLKEGDVITSLGGKPVKEGRELQTAVASLPLGQPVQLQVVREGKPVNLEVTIEEQPQDFGTARVPVPQAPHKEKEGVKLEQVGLEVAELTPELAEQFGYKETARGVVITAADRDGPAYEAGLRRGMVIVKVNKQAVKSPEALGEMLGKSALAEGVLFQVQSPQGGTSFFVLKAATAEK